MGAPATMPAVFFGHGNPMNTLQQNRYTEAWAAFGAAARASAGAGGGAPRAVLAVSAHWYINATAVTAMAAPRTIHDFFGFPPELFAFTYPAPGDPELAAAIAEVVAPVWVGLDLDSWGLDHGTWSLLAHVFPAADVPVVQLSVDASKPPSYHFELGRRLAPLRSQGVVVLCSGNVVHNLGAIDRAMVGRGHDWAQRFDAEVGRRLAGGEGATLVDLVDTDDYRLAAPTPDHFLPLLYLAGLAEAAGEPARAMLANCEYGGLSMTSYTLGL